MTIQIGFHCEPSLTEALQRLRQGSQVFISGTYTFEVDGYAVNADLEYEPAEQPPWRREVLAMSLMLLESIAQMRKGYPDIAGCYYDYLEFEIRRVKKGMLELKSSHVGEWDGDHQATCSEAEFWPAFAAATDTWMAELRDLQQQLEAKSDLIVPAHLQKLIEDLALFSWEQAYASWCAADLAAQNASPKP